jgi:MoaA/NifB/PqqE/SkfB family radical SAM enzyme
MIISANELEQQLKLQFNIKIMCDVGELSTDPSALFKLLQSAYQEKYNQDDRLVFYTSYLLSEKFLQHLYETINFIDISNCFVLICGPAELEQAILLSGKKFSQDPVPVQFQSVSLATTLPIEDKFSLPDTICAIPWMNLEISQNGNISPCCVSKLILGNIKNITLEQAFYGDKLQKFRDNFLAGDRPIECSTCWKTEEKKLTSTRLHNSKRLKKEFLTKSLNKPQFSTLDIKFNNTCNFKCRICGPESSSLSALEHHQVLGKPLILQDNWGESQNFINQVIKQLPNIQNIDMFGGEPFLIKKFKKVLQLAVNNGHAENIRLHYNSNGSIWPTHFLPYWPSFKLVDIHFSIDAIGKQFELQRGGAWQEVEDNILNLKNLGLKNLDIRIMPTVSVMSIYYMDQVYDWATKHGFPVFVGHANGAGMELQYLTRQAKAIIIEKFKDHPWAEMQKIIKIIQELPDSDGKEFWSKINWFDQHRKENFSDSHFEIANAMKFV